MNASIWETLVARTHVVMTVHTRRVALVALTLFVWAGVGTPARAEHRARLSEDLSDHLAAGSQSIDIIVDGDQTSVNALAGRYNVVVKRRLKSGAVLHVNAGQLDALSHDADIDHLSGDITIRPTTSDRRCAAPDPGGRNRLFSARQLCPISMR